MDRTEIEKQICSLVNRVITLQARQRELPGPELGVPLERLVARMERIRQLADGQADSLGLDVQGALEKELAAAEDDIAEMEPLVQRLRCERAAQAGEANRSQREAAAMAQAGQMTPLQALQALEAAGYMFELNEQGQVICRPAIPRDELLSALLRYHLHEIRKLLRTRSEVRARDEFETIG